MHDSPSKKGLQLPDKIIENSNIHLTKAVEDLPSSIFHFEPWKAPLDMSSSALKQVKVKDPSNLHKYQFDFSTANDIMWKNGVAKPTKKSVFDA